MLNVVLCKGRLQRNETLIIMLNRQCKDVGCCSKNCVDWSLLVLRLGAGVVFLLHGWGKLFSNAPGLEGFTGMLAGLGFPVPEFFAYFVGIIEFFGGIALIFGVWVSIFAPLLAIVMLVAFVTVKQSLPAGDADLALFAITVALTLSGPGSFSLWSKGGGALPSKSKGSGGKCGCGPDCKCDSGKCTCTGKKCMCKDGKCSCK